ncbi:MAG: polysaccharide deacetylase family protein [Verrucomicrobia bacterium]|nr:polysaccharide deacetylase family protein [Verrucomicrobiota bacterium]
MKNSLFLRLWICASLLLPAALGLGGCQKLKSLTSKKSTDSQSSSAGGGTGKDTAANATPAATPKPTSVAPAINKSAAVMVLCYHRFEEKPHDALAIAPAEFEKEMQELKDNNFSVIPMQDFLAWRRGDKDIPPKCAIISIDDGYVSGYDLAWPILKKFGYPFTMFVYINYIGSGGKSVSWDQLAEMRDAGVDIECHSYSHSSLKSPGGGTDRHTREMVMKDVQSLGVDGWLRKEIVESKQVLEKQLGIKCNVFAYPFGVYSQKAREMVKEAGYEAAFTVYGQRLGNSSPAFDLLGRYAVEFNKPQIFADAIKMVGGGTGGPLPQVPANAQLASASMLTQPADSETISNPKPLIKANLATMGDIEPGSVEMRVSGLGLVPAKYDAATKTVSYQVPQNLNNGDYSVILNAKVGGRRVETRWSFKYDPNSGGR